jgi:hypothetical protein
LAAEGAVGSVVVVEVFPFLELVVEELGLVDDDPVEHPVELFGVDAVGPFHFAVESGGPGFDVDVSDPPVQDVVVELAGEFGAVVGLDHLDWEGELGQEIVEELDGGLLVAAGIDAEDPEAGAVVDGGELVVALAGGADGGDELDVDLDLVAGLGFLVAFPPLLMALVSLRGGEAVEVEPFQEGLSDPLCKRGGLT